MLCFIHYIAASLLSGTGCCEQEYPLPWEQGKVRLCLHSPVFWGRCFIFGVVLTHTSAYGLQDLKALWSLHVTMVYEVPLKERKGPIWSFDLVCSLIWNGWEGPMASPVANFFLAWCEVKAFFILLTSDQVAECTETFIHSSAFPPSSSYIYAKLLGDRTCSQ